MTPENSNKPLPMNDKPMTAWESAATLGLDTSLLECTFSLTPTERIRFHDNKLKLFLMLEQRAGLQRSIEPMPPSVPPEFTSSNTRVRTLYGNHH